MSRYWIHLSFLVCALLLPFGAQAQSGAALEIDQNRIKQFFQNCLEGTGGDQESDSSQARSCTRSYFSQCSEAGGSTANQQRACWGALESYWSSVVALRAKRIEGVAPAKLKRYVQDSARAEERYRKERCQFYRYLQGAWTGPAEAKCLTDTLIDRAVDLQVIQENMPR